MQFLWWYVFAHYLTVHTLFLGQGLGAIWFSDRGSPCNDISIVNPARKGIYDELNWLIMLCSCSHNVYSSSSSSSSLSLSPLFSPLLPPSIYLFLLLHPLSTSSSQAPFLHRRGHWTSLPRVLLYSLLCQAWPKKGVSIFSGSMRTLSPWKLMTSRPKAGFYR